jgi:hypothetical protein
MTGEPRRSPVTEPSSPDVAERDIGDLENETIFDPTGATPARVEYHDDESGGRDPFFATDEGKAWLDDHEQGAAG